MIPRIVKTALKDLDGKDEFASSYYLANHETSEFHEGNTYVTRSQPIWPFARIFV